MRSVFTGAARATLLLTTCRAFYLPGVAPRTFRYGDKVELKVNKLTSVHTQIPRAPAPENARRRKNARPLARARNAPTYF